MPHYISFVTYFMALFTQRTLKGTVLFNSRKILQIKTWLTFRRGKIKRYKSAKHGTFKWGDANVCVCWTGYKQRAAVLRLCISHPSVFMKLSQVCMSCPSDVVCGFISHLSSSICTHISLPWLILFIMPWVEDLQSRRRVDFIRFIDRLSHALD